MSTQPAEPSTYRETLVPSAWIWAVVLAVAASAGLVFLPALGTTVALVTAAAAWGGGVAGLLLTRARSVVRAGERRAGRARIPAQHLGRVRVLTSERMRALRGPEMDARAYLCQRSWIGQGVIVEITDPQDPTPYWLLSSRSPQLLAAALERAERQSLPARTRTRDEPPLAD
jgi:hypothetical protein